MYAPCHPAESADTVDVELIQLDVRSLTVVTPPPAPHPELKLNTVLYVFCQPAESAEIVDVALIQLADEAGTRVSTETIRALLFCTKVVAFV